MSARRPASSRIWARAIPAASLLWLAACAHAPSHPHPPAAAPPTVLPQKPPDVNQVPDAVPREEPRSAFGNPPFYVVAGHRYVVLPTAAGYVERGVASWYGTEFHGLRTSTGESYDMFAMTAAHKTLPLPCYARVTNLSNGRSVVVRINDRGPFVANRIIDLSYSAAGRLDMIRNGTAFVQVEVLTPAAPSLTASMPVSAPAAQSASVGVSSVPAVSVPPVSVPPVSPAPSAPAAAPAPPAAAAPAAPVVTPAPAGTFYIQVGAYAQLQNANGAVRKLRAAGLENVLLVPDAHQSLQRVRIGPIESVQQFDALIERLNALGFPNARLAQD
ncbi:MAG TPA: septal ring lytic transglycosylase RlpA family protein [Steroidobacteraceae bacterium]